MITYRRLRWFVLLDVQDTFAERDLDQQTYNEFVLSDASRRGSL